MVCKMSLQPSVGGTTESKQWQHNETHKKDVYCDKHIKCGQLSIMSEMIVILYQWQKKIKC